MPESPAVTGQVEARLRRLLGERDPFASRVFGRSADIAAWSLTPVAINRPDPASLGIFRITWEDRRRSKRSVCLKILRPAPARRKGASSGSYEGMPFVMPRDTQGAATVRAATRWDREVLAYRSAAVRGASGVRAPRCLAAHRVDGQYWLALEDLGTTPRRAWTRSDFERVALGLGSFNGSTRGVRARPWWSRDWLMSWDMQTATSRQFEELLWSESTWRHPLVRRMYSAHDAARLQRSWQERVSYLRLLKRLPHSFAHVDPHTGNIAIQGHARTADIVLFDWACAGVAALGVDPGQLLGGSLVLTGDLRLGEAVVTDRVIFDSYVSALRTTGGPVDRDGVRLAYLISALRWLFISASITLAVDAHEHRVVEERTGLRVEEVLRARSATTSFLLNLADEARALVTERAR